MEKYVVFLFNVKNNSVSEPMLITTNKSEAIDEKNRLISSELPAHHEKLKIMQTKYNLFKDK